jgi:hypothetical protein
VFYEAVNRIRERWRIEAEVRIPPPLVGIGMHLPPDRPEMVDPGEVGYEKYSNFLSDWTGEMLALYREFIPKGYREPIGPDELYWLKFLSGCVLYDPLIPAEAGEPGLPEFCNALDAPLVTVHLLTRERTLTPTRHSPPLTSVRDARKVEDLPSEAALLVIAALQKEPDLLRGGSAEEVRNALLQHGADLREKLRRLPDEIAPRRTLLDHEAGDTKKELHAELDKLLSTRPEPPEQTQGGRPSEFDPVGDVEAAILADRHGWKGEDVAMHNDWPANHVSRRLNGGREILSSRVQSKTDH